MSFSAPFSAKVISPIEDETYELLSRVPSETESGWESMRDTYLLRNDAAGVDPIAALSGIAGLARQAQISGLNMWIVTRAAKCLAYGLFKVDVLSMGLVTSRGYKVTYDAAAASQSATDVTYESVLHPKVSAREGGVTATFEYVAVASVAPTNADFLTKWTGRAKSLPSGWEPTVPASIWATIGDATWYYPNGWVFDSATMENLPGINTVFLIKEKYVHVQEYTP